MGSVLLVLVVILDWGQYLTTLQSWTGMLTGELCVQYAEVKAVVCKVATTLGGITSTC